jgi:small subunit ribosomal protein S20
MAITKNAKKAHRTSLKKRVYNVRRKVALHDAVKALRDTAVAGKVKEAEALLPAAYKAIDKAEKRGVIKKNTASRKKSRLVALIKRSGK